MQLKAFVAGITLLLLTGCSGQNDSDEGLTDLDTRIMTDENMADIETYPEEDSVSQPAADTTAGSDTSTLKAAKGPIPAAIRGRWGMVAADCTSSHGDAKGLIEISGTDLIFYEARAVLGNVKETEPSRLRARFNFEGEGMKWQSDVLLEVQDSGQTLLRRDYGPDAPPAPTRYKRCLD